MEEDSELRPFVLSDVQLTGTTIAPVRMCVCLCVYAYLHRSLNKPIAGSEMQVASLATNSVANIKFMYKYMCSCFCGTRTSMFGRASGKSKLLKTHDGASCFVVRVEYHTMRPCCN